MTASVPNKGDWRRAYWQIKGGHGHAETVVLPVFLHVALALAFALRHQPPRTSISVHRRRRIRRKRSAKAEKDATVSASSTTCGIGKPVVIEQPNPLRARQAVPRRIIGVGSGSVGNGIPENRKRGKKRHCAASGTGVPLPHQEGREGCPPGTEHALEGEYGRRQTRPSRGDGWDGREGCRRRIRRMKRREDGHRWRQAPRRNVL